MESIEEIDMAITSDLQSIDVHLASIVSVVTGIHHATQQYTQAIRRGSKHLRIWTRFFSSYDRAEAQGSLTSDRIDDTDVVNSTAKANTSATPSSVVDPDPPASNDRMNDCRSEIDSPISVLKAPALPLPMSETPDLMSPLRTVKPVSASEITPEIASIGAESRRCSTPFHPNRFEHCLMTPEFTSPPFIPRLDSPRFDAASTARDGPGRAPRSSLDLDLSFISSVRSSDSPLRLLSEPALSPGDDRDRSISFSRPPAPRNQLADISAFLNRRSDDDDAQVDVCGADRRRQVTLDFDKLPTIYRSGYAQRQIVQVFDYVRRSSDPVTLGALARALDKSDAMIGLMVDVLHQSGYVRPIDDGAERQWATM